MRCSRGEAGGVDAENVDRWQILRPRIGFGTGGAPHRYGSKRRRHLPPVQTQPAASQYMIRPLQLDSIFDLTAKAERHRDNKGELELIRSELNHRTTAAALKLRERV